MNHNKLGKLKELWIPDHLNCLLRILYAGQEATVETLCGQLTGSELRKENDEAVYCHPVFIHRALHAICQQGWMSYKLELWLLGPQICGWYHSNGRKKEELKNLLMRVMEERENASLKVNIKKLRSWHLVPFSSVQFSSSVVSDSLRPHELQHARPPCPSPTPRVYSNSCPSSRWCHPAISSSLIPFSSCPQSLPASGSFPMSQLFAWGGHAKVLGFSFSFSISPSNKHPGLLSFRMDWLDLLVVQGTLKSLLWHHSSKASILQYSDFFIVQAHILR